MCACHRALLLNVCVLSCSECVDTVHVCVLNMRAFTVCFSLLCILVFLFFMRLFSYCEFFLVCVFHNVALRHVRVLSFILNVLSS